MGFVSGRRARDEDGFSLVELLVIVLIIGVLAGIAITTYVRQAEKAERSAAISTLSNMRLAAESIRADDVDSEYSGDPLDYESNQSSYEYTTDHSEGNNEVSIHGDPDGQWVAFAVLGRGKCYFLRLEADSSTLYQHTAEVVDPEDCDAFAFSSGPGVGAWL